MPSGGAGCWSRGAVVTGQISVIVTTYNRVDALGAVLRGLDHQTDRDFEVIIADDGSGVVRAKAWKKGEAEPDKWTIEVPHKTAHQNGSPGLFGFSPQDMQVYIDNVTVTSNEK